MVHLQLSPHIHTTEVVGGQRWHH